MSILDYTKNLTLFDSYEIRLIEMMIEELDLEETDDCMFLEEINLSEVEIYWYSDSSENVMGGFHMLGKNALYINREYFGAYETESYVQKMLYVVSAFPTIIHELCHYWQFKSHPILYFFLQLPKIRDFTIEKQAYRISDYLEANSKFNNMSIKELTECKKKYNFPKNYYDATELRYL